MIGKVFKLIRLPMLLIVIFTIGRFILSVKGVPYSPRSNAVFTILPLILISSFYFGALSGKVNGIGWVGAILLGVFIGFFGEFMILLATMVSYMAHVDTYFTYWDNLNVKEGTTVTMVQALGIRAGGLIAGPILGTIAALIGRALGGLVSLQ